MLDIDAIAPLAFTNKLIVQLAFDSALMFAEVKINANADASTALTVLEVEDIFLTKTAALDTLLCDEISAEALLTKTALQVILD
jgi:hypothetical protein